METSLVQPTTRRRAPLSALAKLTIAALLGIVCLIVYAQVILVGQFEPDLTIFAVVMLLVSGVIAIGWRWAPLLGALLSALVVFGDIDLIIHDLMHPEAFRFFVSVLAGVAIGVVGIVAGISATVQNYRSPERRQPRVMAPALLALAALCLGAILVAAIPREAGAGINPEVLAGLPAIITPGFSFDPAEIRAKVGETVAFRLDNPHNAPHSFDIDELNVHVSVAPGEQGLILFKPARPGTYTFYCAVPSHRELGMEGTLIVEP